MSKKRNEMTLMVLVAALCAAFSGMTVLHSQDSDAAKPKQKTTEKRKAKPAKPSNPTEGTSPSPAKNSGNKAASKDTSQTAKAPVGKETVWVNTATGVYHKKGARYYGKTKEGKYMPEDEAVQAGYKRSKRN